MPPETPSSAPAAAPHGPAAAPHGPAAAPHGPAAAPHGPAPTGPRPDRPDRPERIGPPREGIIRRSDTSRCRTAGCTKYHDFFQFQGKYYCLECYETLRNAAKLKEAEAR